MDQLVHETYDAAFKVVDVSDSDGIYVPPHLLYGPKPTVPATEPDGPLAGTVVVFFLITSDGQVKEPVIITSSEPRLNAEVLATLRRWIFTPARMNGRPVPVTAGQEFTLP
jgi:TonB family protein